LWCPPLTHYTKDGTIDIERMDAHLRFMSSHVKGYLVFGTTGDGWDLTEGEKRELLDFFIAKGKSLGIRMLVGSLQYDAKAVREDISRTLQFIKDRTGASSDADAMALSNVLGFAVCPPRGKELSQRLIEESYASVFEMRLPIAVYQLPQVTQNEASPEVLASLAARFPNFLLFKDTSGNDRAVLSGALPGKVYCVRGMEGDYARWLDPGTLYDGFLLSMANCMPVDLDRMIGLHLSGKRTEALALSDHIAAVKTELHEVVSDIIAGNKFTNSVKAMDHILAWGTRALDALPPRLHAGVSLSREHISKALGVLARRGIRIEKGYMA
jgi:dihydrodipicolinate synthase/N-acetylneuraminate lyase